MRAVDVCERKRRFQKGEGLSEKLSYYVEGKQQIDCQKKKRCLNLFLLPRRGLNN